LIAELGNSASRALVKIRESTKDRAKVNNRAQDARPNGGRVARVPAVARPKAAQGSRASVQSLMLGLRVIEALASTGRERGITELATQLGTTKWRIFRHLHSLCDEGYVTQDSVSGKFQLGRRTYALLESLPNRFNFVREARDEMTALRALRGHTVVLAAPVDETCVVVVDAIEGVNAVQFSLKIGAIFDLHASAHGKAALAFGPSAWLENAIARGLRRHTEFTITDPRVLRREIERVRSQGWASAFEESFRGVNTVVAPIFAASRNYVGTIAVFGSVEALPRTPDRKDVEAVVSAARRISQRLGWK
jgi:IclR family KDG regulon transcriptional repressor